MEQGAVLKLLFHLIIDEFNSLPDVLLLFQNRKSLFLKERFCSNAYIRGQMRSTQFLRLKFNLRQNLVGNALSLKILVDVKEINVIAVVKRAVTNHFIVLFGNDDHLVVK